MKKRVLFDEVMISRMITRIANEIIEQNKLEEIVLVGIQTRGIYIAKRLKQKIGEIENINIPVESLDIKFFTINISMIGYWMSYRHSFFYLKITSLRK